MLATVLIRLFVLHCASCAFARRQDLANDGDLLQGETTISPAAGLGSVRMVASTWAESQMVLGIPFARPPEGELALMPPVQYPEPWESLQGMEDFPPACTQFGGPQGEGIIQDLQKKIKYLGVQGQRDCLYLNIFIPKGLAKEEKLPVMFFIHGGGFMNGDTRGFGIYDASALASNTRTIVVSANYRVGAEGFLAHPSMQDAGGQYNLGLLDQRMAMRWTHRHIRSFKGDPEKMILFGESAGAMSICFHMTSPQSFPYFRGAIMQSGGCEGSAIWGERSRSETFAVAYAIHLGCTTHQRAAVGYLGSLDCLREHIRGNDFPSFDQWSRISGPLGHVPDSLYPLTPVVDKTPGGLDMQPTELVELGRFHKVPIIIGTNKDEGFLFSFMNPFEGSKDGKSFELFASHFAGPNRSADIEKTYGALAGRTATAMLMGDTLFECPTRSFASQVSGHNPNSVFFYRFSFQRSGQAYAAQTTKAIWDVFSQQPQEKLDGAVGLFMDAMGVPHAYDLFFVFDTRRNPRSQVIAFGEAEQKISSTFQSYWGRFAWTLDPNNESEVDFEWPRFDHKHPWETKLHISDPLTTNHSEIDQAIFLRCQMWLSHKGQPLRTSKKPWQTEGKYLPEGTCRDDFTVGERVEMFLREVNPRTHQEEWIAARGTVQGKSWAWKVHLDGADNDSFVYSNAVRRLQADTSDP